MTDDSASGDSTGTSATERADSTDSTGTSATERADSADAAAVRAVLAPFDATVKRRLHGVPPHAVWLVAIDGSRFVCKLNTESRGRAGVEGRVMRFVDRYTSLPVPRVAWVGHEAFLTAHTSRAPMPGTTGDVSWARVAGRALARFHAETAAALDGYGRFTLAEAASGSGAVPTDPTADGDTTTADDHTVRPETDATADQPTDGIAGVETTETHASPREWARAYVEARRPVLERHERGDVADRVTASLRDAPAIFDRAGPAVCRHGWATPEHVAVRDDVVRCVVDFEHALAGPGEFDLWWSCGVGVETGEGRTALVTAYDDVRPLADGFERRRPYYRLLDAVAFYESLYVQNQHGPRETTARAERLDERVEELLAGVE